MESIGPLELLLLLIPSLVAIIDMLVIPNAAWRAAHQSYPLWLLAVLVLGPIGVVAYLVAARPKLSRARAQLRDPR